MGSLTAAPVITVVVSQDMWKYTPFGVTSRLILDKQDLQMDLN